jgi:hypothetical protein
MENKDRTKQGENEQGIKPGQGGTSNQPGRPTPSGVPNEGRGAGAQERQGGAEYRGGRQGQSGVPNPDDADDVDSAGSFRGTAEEGAGGDDDDDIERGVGTEKTRGPGSTSPGRQPSPNADQRRVKPWDEDVE